MDGVGRSGRGLWRNLKQRLGFKGIGCCGSSWSLGASNMNLREEDALEEEPVSGDFSQIPAETSPAPPCVAQTPATRASSGVDLETALASERNLRPAGSIIGPTTETPTLTPLRSLLGLFEETDGEDRKRDKEGPGGIEAVCCVCMERNKGAAFIPCGHTYCRVCTRELWLNRRSCPLCNRPITDILDIFLST